MALHNIQDWLSGRSSWGASEKSSDVPTLRRLKKIYDSFAVIGEIAVFVLFIGLVCACTWLLTKTSFEDVIFWDSTSHICVYDSSSGEIVYVGGK